MKTKRLCQQLTPQSASPSQVEPFLLSLPPEVLQRVLSLCEREALCRHVRPVCRRLEAAVAALLRADLWRLGRRLHLLADSLEARAAADQEAAAAALALRAVHDQFRQVRAATWRYSQRACLPAAAGRLLDEFWRLWREASARPPALGAAFFGGRPSAQSRLAAACSDFLDLFEQHAEPRLHRHWSDAGAKLVDLLDCARPSACSRFHVRCDDSGTLHIEASYRLQRTWFTCITGPKRGRTHFGWRLEQRFMFMRVRRLVAKSNSLRLQEERFTYDHQLRKQKAEKCVPMVVPPTTYSGYGLHAGKFYYYGSMNCGKDSLLQQQHQAEPEQCCYVDFNFVVHCQPHLAPFRVFRQQPVCDAQEAWRGSQRRHFRLYMTVTCPAATRARLPGVFTWAVPTEASHSEVDLST